jgi:integrase
VASVEKRQRSDSGHVTWRARYRDPSGKDRSKTFRRKVDAEKFLIEVENSKLTGSYIDNSRGRVTLGEWADLWLVNQVQLKPSTYARYEGILREHIKPRWRDVELSKVTHSDVQSWVAELTAKKKPLRGRSITQKDRAAAPMLSANTVQKIYRVFSSMLTLAVQDGRLLRNPADGVKLPKIVRKPQRFLTHEQVRRLADAAAKDPESKHAIAGEREIAGYRLVVLFLAYTGVRWGEMAALRIHRIDLTRRRATIAESVTPVMGKGLVWGTPKSGKFREVPIPRFLIDALKLHLDGRDPAGLVFPGARSGEVLRVAAFTRGSFKAAASAIGIPDLHPHELRHTAASLAIAAGADVKVVQEMLGHASATMTLDLYGHLFNDRLDTVAEAMDAARAAALEDGGDSHVAQTWPTAPNDAS